MAQRKLDIACWNYDRMQALRDREVVIDGVDATFYSGKIVVDIFEAMINDRAYDIAELGLTYFLRTMDPDESPFLALPVFPVRSFRHSAIYINKAKGIAGPKDLIGKTIGEMALYGHDAGVMAKGILADEFGVKPEQCRWVVGGIDFPIKPIDWLPKPVPDGIDVTYVGADTDLGALLENGDIDALIAADTPKCVLEKSDKVGRLFEEYEEIERDYYRRSGIFPIMHVIAVRKQLALQEPEIVKAVYKGFCAAKDAMEQKLTMGMTFNNMTVMIPWLSHLIERDRELLGNDWWPYGIARNRTAIDTYLRYHFEQGLSKRRLTIEDVFVPYLLES